MGGTPAQLAKRRAEYATNIVARRIQAKVEWANRDPEYLRAWRMLKRYGVNRQEFETIMQIQDFKCALCNKLLNLKRPKAVHIGHCHDTGAIRGILCSACNLALGRFSDSIDKLQRAIDYLRKKPVLVPKNPRIGPVNKPKIKRVKRINGHWSGNPNDKKG